MISSETMIAAIDAARTKLPRECLVVVFCLKPLVTGTQLSYISNANRDDMIDIVEGWLKDQYERRRTEKENRN